MLFSCGDFQAWSVFLRSFIYYCYLRVKIIALNRSCLFGIPELLRFSGKCVKRPFQAPGSFSSVTKHYLARTTGWGFSRLLKRPLFETLTGKRRCCQCPHGYGMQQLHFDQLIRWFNFCILFCFFVTWPTFRREKSCLMWNVYPICAYSITFLEWKKWDFFL